MLPHRGFEFFKENSITKKSVEQSQNKISNHKISYESLSSKVFDSFMLKLWY